MSLDKFKKSFFISIGVFLFILAVLVGFLIYLNIDIDRRVAAIKRYQTDIAIRNQAVLLLGTLKLEAERGAQLAGQLQEVLPTRDQLITLPRELEKVAKAHRVGFGFAFGNENLPSGTNPGSVRFTISLTGQIADLVSFLKDLEFGKRILNVQSFDLTQRRDAKDFSLILSGEVYIH
jgi:Tfp pilus assembly protein PilO